MLQEERREERRSRKGRRDYAMIECVVRAMGEAERWKDGGASGSEGLRVGVVLGGGAVGLIAWVENAERERKEKTKRNRSSI